MANGRFDRTPLTLADWPAYANDHPLILFRRFALIADAETASVIIEHCAMRGFLAGIDYAADEELACYVWHSLLEAATQRSWRFPIAKRILAALPPMLTDEQRIIADVAALLTARGTTVSTEVVCAAGRADIVTDHPSVIYEVKPLLTRVALFQAVGQVLLYRTVLNPAAHAAILGYPTRDTDVLQPYIEQLGIRVIRWKHQEGGRRKEEGGSAQAEG